MTSIGKLLVCGMVVASACSFAAEAQSTKPATASGATLTVSGHPGQIPVVQIGGHSYVEVDALARLTQSAIAYRTGGVVLTLSTPKAADVPTLPAKKVGFSQPFLTAAIEEMTVVREWRIALVNAVQNNYPINEDWMSQYRRNAESKLQLTSAAVTTDADRQGYPLLASDFANMAKQGDRFLTMRKNLQFIATFTLDQDPLDQQILACSRGLAALASSGQFEDVPSCH
jgi:hypothetical protein